MLSGGADTREYVSLFIAVLFAIATFALIMGVHYKVATGPLLGWAALSALVGGVFGFLYWAFGHKHAKSTYSRLS